MFLQSMLQISKLQSMERRLPRWLLCFLTLFGLFVVQPVASCSNSSSYTSNDHTTVQERIGLVMNILSSVSTNEHLFDRTVDVVLSQQQHEQVLNILSTIRNELQPPLSHSQHQRNLEEQVKDDDDYFQYYNIYQNAKNSDVSVSYDEADNTIVTVGDDVIVRVEHRYAFYLYNGGMVVFCILAGGMMAGLLMGMMSLDPLIVSVKARTAPTEQERRKAIALLPFIQKKNLVLVSLLLVNCGTNEALPIFLDTLLGNPWLTVAFCLTVVLVIGEILPSAYFTGRDPVKTAADLIPVLRFVIVMTSPISYPLSKLMDHYFQHDAEVPSFKRGEITAMVRIQYEEQLARKKRLALEESLQGQSDASIVSMKSFSDNCETCNPCEPFAMFKEADLYACVPHDQCSSSPDQLMHEDLCNDDIVKLEGALSIKIKKVESVYTPMNRVVSVMANAILNEDMVVKMYSYGYSRIPVMNFIDESKGTLGVCGVLLTKQLMLVDKADRRIVTSLTLYEPPCVSPQTSLADALNIILSGKRKSSIMALVCMDPDLASSALRLRQPVPMEAGVVGIITLENVLEELIQEQIYDEKDRKMNPKLERAKWAIAKWKAFVLRKRIDRDEGNIINPNYHPFDYIRMNEIL
jgi:metal transporter CNNM